MISPKYILSADRTDFDTPPAADKSIPAAQNGAENSGASSAHVHGLVPKLDALTSLRFFAAAMLVLFHADLFLNKTHVFAGIALKQGVCFFFVLSGFVLFYNYPTLASSTEKAKFFIARFARIWPAQAVVVLLVLLLLPSWSLGAHGIKLLTMVTSELLMVQSYIPNWKYYLAINSPAWSISTEFFFYALFPFLLLNWDRTWIVKLCGAAVVTILAIIAASIVSTQPFTQDTKQLCNYLVYINPAARLLEFVVGMATAYAFKAARSSFNLNNVSIGLMQVASVMLVVAALVACPMSVHELSKPIPSALASWIDGSGGFIAFALLIFSMAFSQGFIAKALSDPRLVLLGEISYSIYLIHWLILILLQIHINDGSLHVARWEYISGYVLLLVGVSYLMYRYIEKPCRRYLTKVLNEVWDAGTLQRLVHKNVGD